MGTGVGRASYSIMAQGNITQLLSSKPEDRRIVFEEAAGITKFKVQKKEALRKLDHTEQNLLRVADLVGEVKRRIGSLQRQAGKAKRYKQIQGELQHLETQLARHEYDLLQTEIESSEQSRDALKEQQETSSGLVLQKEEEIRQLRSRLAELEAEISLSQQQGMELKGQMDRHEGNIHFHRERSQELEQQHQRVLEEIDQFESRKDQAEEQLTSLGLQLEEAQKGLSVHQQTVGNHQDALRQVEAASQSRQEAVQKVQGELFAHTQQLGKWRNERSALEYQSKSQVERLEKLASEKIQLEEERQGWARSWRLLCLQWRPKSRLPTIKEKRWRSASLDSRSFRRRLRVRAESWTNSWVSRLIAAASSACSRSWNPLTKASAKAPWWL